MVEKRLIDYFRKGLSQGYSIESLRKSLIRQGVHERDVDEALQYIQKKQPAAPEEEGKKRPVGVIIIFILGLLGSIGSVIFGAIFAFLDPAVLYGPEVLALFPDSILNQLFTIGVVNLVIGIIGLLAYILFFQMKKIGWILVILIGIFGIAYGIINLAISGFDVTLLYSYIGGLIYNIIILAYVFLKKDLFL